MAIYLQYVSGALGHVYNNMLYMYLIYNLLILIVDVF